MICRLCPRNCGALRTETEGRGWCRVPSTPVLARAALHMKPGFRDHLLLRLLSGLRLLPE